MLKAFLSPWGRRPRLTYWRSGALLPLMTLLALTVMTVIAHRLSPHPGSVTNVVVVILVRLARIAILPAALGAGLAIAIQRLHDQDKSGWWVLIALVPVIGTLWYLFWNGLRPGTPGPNRFGPDPSARYAAVTAVFGDGAPPRPVRRPIVSTIVTWLVLLAILAFVVLFQPPHRRPPRPVASPPAPLQN